MISSDNYKKPIFYGWWIMLACLILMSVGFGTSLYLYSVVADAIQQSYPGGRFLLMMGAAGLLFTSGFMSPKVGSLLDHLPVKNVVIVGALMMGLGFILISLSNNIWQVIACYLIFVAGGMTTLSPLTTFTLLSRWFVHHRGLAIGIASLGTQFGGLIFPPVTAYFIEAVGWRAAIGGSGVFILIIVPMLAYYVIEDRPEVMGLYPDGAALPVNPDEEIRLGRDKVNLSSICTNRTFLLLVFIVGCSSAVNISTVTSLSLFATDLGESIERGAYLISLLSILGMISSPLVGRLFDIWNIRVLSTIMLLFSVTASIVFFSADSYPVFIVATILQGVTGGCVLPLWASLVARIYGTQVYGQVMGATTLVVFSLTALAPIFSGWIYDVTGGYRLLFLIMFIMMLLAVLGLWLLPIPGNREETNQTAVGNV